jgi:hypothetical protein
MMMSKACSASACERLCPVATRAKSGFRSPAGGEGAFKRPCLVGSDA